MAQYNQTQFLEILKSRATQVDNFLTGYLNAAAQNGEIARPERLVSAMRHGVLNGGKRIRPFFVMEIAQMLGAEEGLALYPAAGLECLHSYSLVHDDLPAMDDDELRRGKPTVHIAYDEATAILAGDALLTLAFDLTVHEKSGLLPKTQVELVRALARDSGAGGMVGGQQLDLDNENKDAGEDMISRIHAMKTGALIRYSCEAGAIIAGSDQEERQNIRRYGELVGLAFQLADDLLDVTSDVASMGKATGKDADAGKSTLIAIHGVEWARKRLDQLVEEAERLLVPYGEKADIIRAATQFVAKRQS
ncbi:farnesyl diphosphate synthase [Ahrensia kielensis]|uniref:polyprenyl synthetase family protein n=1 Tax=Ahrensia kielensis TaxID=76980 RepID=UPI0003640856